MFIVVALLILVGIILIWFHIPYSPVKKEFQNDFATLKVKNQVSVTNEIFTKEDFSHLPTTIQAFLENCGYLGTVKMSYMKMTYKDVEFKQGKNKPSLIIDYTQYNFIADPSRIALINSSMFTIPFEGYDYYQNGRGGMKGVLAKAITLFDQTGTDMDKGSLATFLAESLFAPTILLQKYIDFEEISNFEVQATINNGGQTATGIFTFNERYEMISFTTKDRAVIGPDGTTQYIPWSALCGDYQFAENGIKYPTKFQAVWNYSDGDFIYFNGKINEISYGFTE